jgi:hypothetical protein
MKDDDQNKFIPQLATDLKLFHRAFINPFYNVKPNAQSEGCAPYCAIGS